MTTGTVYVMNLRCLAAQTAKPATTQKVPPTTMALARTTAWDVPLKVLATTIRVLSLTMAPVTSRLAWCSVVLKKELATSIQKQKSTMAVVTSSLVRAARMLKHATMTTPQPLTTALAPSQKRDWIVTATVWLMKMETGSVMPMKFSVAPMVARAIMILRLRMPTTHASLKAAAAAFMPQP